ncbi:riboflavin kinase [Enhydrobacter aerosaccus]|uniref:Riboflavin biosynthesis protein n=1 Tax=Enhydrobacter aerosaccus TaxID=225324 RepID=A0ABR5INB7_9HYPH|nr:riboflavin biosynthesis protein RibF [Enhydrobacter aerosaccus]KND22482.1 riboflavin kinase [Enhydrobacter aerosaccus]
MNVIDLSDWLKHPTLLPDSVLTIGNFDGVHLGHQAMLDKAKSLAKSQQLASMVMIFEPQPREFFSPQTAPARLTNLAEKTQLIAEHRIDNLIVANFDNDFRNLSAHDFAKMLVELNVKHLVLGDDFRFGHDRTGDSEFLRAFGLPVQILHTVTDHAHQDERVSSTRIRDCLQQGDLATAKHLLGRDYAITGMVEHGDKIGRTLDFPTANIALNRIKPALHGIFAVSVTASDGTDLSTLGKNTQTGVQGLTKGSLFGACNVGTRPALKNKYAVEWRLEVNFPKFEGDLYGRELTVTFLHFLHGEKNYAGLDALKQGIAQDVVDLLNWREQQAFAKSIP